MNGLLLASVSELSLGGPDRLPFPEKRGIKEIILCEFHVCEFKH